MPPTSPTPDTLRPWQFFTLGALICATAAVFVIRGSSAENLIFVCLGIFAAGLVGLSALNALRPLVTGEVRQPEMIGSRTRAALEREKNLVLRSIKELEFDRAMGKVGERDFEEMSARLRARAVRLLDQLDHAGSGYRELVERELASRLGKSGSLTGQRAEGRGQTESEVQSPESGVESPEPKAQSPEPRVAEACASCSTVNDQDARFCKGCGTKLLALLFAALMFAAPVFAQIQMPDPKEMSGIPRPVTDLAAGRVSVRLIRGQLSNNISGHPVEVHAAGKVLTVKTDENGRAEFSGVPAGTTAKTTAVVDGERLESQEFSWPGDGGIRVMLVATEKSGAGPPAVFQPVPGNVAFGDQTRVIIEPGEDALQVYYILDIQNSARAPVNPPSALILDMPTGALSTSVLAGAPKAVATGARVTVTGPFSPGRTSVEVAYRMPFSTGEVAFEQMLPLALPGVAVLMKKVGNTTLTSPQLPNVQEREVEGDRYILAQGSTIAAGGTLALQVSGLPHHNPIPRQIALVLAVVVLGGGIWASTKRPSPGADAGRRKQLTSRREKLFSELVRLEQQKWAGAVDAARYAERRPALVAQLERVYRDLDAEEGPEAIPHAAAARGGPGAAA